MAGPNTRTQKIIDKFLYRLQEHIVVEEVYLFGSFVTGKAKKYSDIDLAIVSPDFKKMPPFDRLVFLGKIAWEAGTPNIEAIGYTRKEFETNSPLDFPTEIKISGIPVHVKRVA